MLTNEPVSGVAPSLEAVLGGSGLIDGVITYNVAERSFWNLTRLMLKLRATRADTMIYLTAGRGLQTVRRDLRFFRYCGLRKFVGAPVNDDLHNNRTEQNGEHEPEAERLARTLSELGQIDLGKSTNWDLRLTAQEHNVAMKLLAPLEGTPFFCFSIGTKLASNQWEKAKWLALFANLTSPMAGMALVGIGADRDFAPTQRLLNHWSGPTLNLCGVSTPRQSAAVLSRARLFVGHDSGPMHLSAAVGTPTVGLFGNNNPPRRWHPFGPYARAVQDMRGMQFVEVPQVICAILEVLEFSRG